MCLTIYEFDGITTLRRELFQVTLKHNILTLQLYSEDEKNLKETSHSIEWSYD